MKTPIGLTFMLILIMGLGCKEATPTSPVAEAQYKIMFVAGNKGSFEIHVINADATNQIKILASNPAVDDDFPPVWSPDGKMIAFGQGGIRLIDRDGSNLRLLETGGIAPVWSPDGKQIAFVAEGNGQLEIYSMNADGTNRRNLTNNAVWDVNPSWSPDGRKIAFISNRDGDYAIYAVNTDGSGQQRLARNFSRSFFFPNWLPQWSPDGAKIAFTSNRDGNEEIYVMNSDSTNQQNLSNNPATDSYSSWSPDGKKILFSSYRDTTFGIYVMNSDGTNQQKIGVGLYAIWSPDGSMIAFYAAQGANVPIFESPYGEIYVMNADGTNPRRITNNAVFEWFFAWSPVRLQ